MARTRPRPFLDTNVFFSGLYRADSPPAAILEHHAKGKINIIVSRQVLEELVTTIRTKKPNLLPRLQTFLTNAPPEICMDPTLKEVQRIGRFINPADAPILAAAIKTRADCLITGNTRHFTEQVAKAARVTIFTPSQFLSSLRRFQKRHRSGAH